MNEKKQRVIKAWAIGTKRGVPLIGEIYLRKGMAEKRLIDWKENWCEERKILKIEIKVVE